MSACIVNLEEDTPVGDRHRDEVLDIIAENMVKAVHTLKELVESTKVDDEHIPGIVKETDCWDIYNNEARKHDTALVKEGRESLNSLLLFVSRNILLYWYIFLTYISRHPFLLRSSPHSLSKARGCWNRTRQRYSSIYSVCTSAISATSRAPHSCAPSSSPNPKPFRSIVYFSQASVQV